MILLEDDFSEPYSLALSDVQWTQAIDHVINSAAKMLYMSGGKIAVPIVFRGPNGAAAGVGAQHSQVQHYNTNLLKLNHT